MDVLQCITKILKVKGKNYSQLITENYPGEKRVEERALDTERSAWRPEHSSRGVDHWS